MTAAVVTDTREGGKHIRTRTVAPQVQSCHSSERGRTHRGHLQLNQNSNPSDPSGPSDPPDPSGPSGPPDPSDPPDPSGPSDPAAAVSTHTERVYEDY